MFLNSQNASEYESLFTDAFTLCKLAYMVDIFEIFKKMCRLQGKESTIMSLSENIVFQNEIRTVFFLNIPRPKIK